MAKVTVDFTGVESGGGGSVWIPEGDYGFEIKSVKQRTSDAGNACLDVRCKVIQGNPKGVGKVLPHNCTLTKKALWNLKNLLEACGKPVPQKAINLDTDKMVGWKFAGTAIDDEYNGKKKSTISDMFPLADLAAFTPTTELDKGTDANPEAVAETIEGEDEAEDLFE